MTSTLLPAAGRGAPPRGGRSIRGVTGPPEERRPAVLLPRGAAWALAGGYAVFVVVGLVRRLPDDPALAWAAAVVALLAGVAMVGVRPALLAPVAAVAAAGVAVLGSAVPSNIGWFAVCILGGWCAFAGPRPGALLFWAGALALFAGEQLWGRSDPGWAAWAVGTSCTVAAALLVRRERGLVADLRAAQAGLADRARAEERSRIARDLHDVIAHSLTVSLLHVASARMAVRYAPEDADRALEEAERLGRESLDEVRSTVGLLRTAGGGREAEGPAAPLPGMADLPVLVERFRSAGAEVSFHQDGAADDVPATVGLAVYRIVQQALTNAATHAPGAPVVVTVGIADRIELAVDSAGRPASGRGPGLGLGLDSMRERAESVGGTLTAGPQGSGWAVRAQLPLRARRAPGGPR